MKTHSRTVPGAHLLAYLGLALAIAACLAIVTTAHAAEPVADAASLRPSDAGSVGHVTFEALATRSSVAPGKDTANELVTNRPVYTPSPVVFDQLASAKSRRVSTVESTPPTTVSFERLAQPRCANGQCPIQTLTRPQAETRAQTVTPPAVTRPTPSPAARPTAQMICGPTGCQPCPPQPSQPFRLFSRRR